METVSYKTEKKETENGIEETKTVSIEFLGGEEKPYSQFLNIKRKKGITTISVTEEDEHEPFPLTKFEATIEDEKLKQAASYMGEMFLNVGKLALMKFINESKEENS
jgi:hypothetical protein